MENFVISRGQGVPNPTHPDYEFCQTRDMPPITRHEFEVWLAPCQYPCWRSYLDIFGVHRCIPGSRRNIAVKRIPKKKTRWLVLSPKDEPDQAWGLQARQVPSFWRISVYVLLCLLAPSVFWGWWLGKMNPTDWQNASVPMTIAIALMALFFAQSNLVRSLREGI